MMSSLSKLSNSFMTVLMLLIFVGMVVVASRYPPGARFMPFVLGFPAIALCLLQLVLDARERRATVRTAGLSEIEKAEEQISRAAGKPIHFDVGEMLLPQTDLDPREQIRRELIAWGYFLGLILGIILFGFHVSVPLFLFLFLRYRAKASWRMTIGLTLAASIALFFVFERVLRISLHPGFITDRVMDMISG
jgi:hypothetical protein